MRPFYEKNLNPVGPDDYIPPYVLYRKRIQNGSIKTNTHGKKLKQLEAVLIVDPNPHNYQNARFGEPIRVIGVKRVLDSTYKPKGFMSYGNFSIKVDGRDDPNWITVWRDGFVCVPDNYYICTSAHASGLIPLDTYIEMFKHIRTADDVVDLKKFINKAFDTVC